MYHAEDYPNRQITENVEIGLWNQEIEKRDTCEVIISKMSAISRVSRRKKKLGRLIVGAMS
jgi:hypothetical protein